MPVLGLGSWGGSAYQPVVFSKQLSQQEVFCETHALAVHGRSVVL